MHPESDIASRFWTHVSLRAHGHNGGSDWFPWYPLVAEKAATEFDSAVDRGEITSSEGMPRLIYPMTAGRELSEEEQALAESIVARPQAWSAYYDEETGLPPRGFATLQGALYDFLLAHVGNSEIACQYDLWLRAVTVILADAAKDQGRLTITVVKDRHGHDPIPNTMSISDDWSVLTPSTFDYVVRKWRQAEELGWFQRKSA